MLESPELLTRIDRGGGLLRVAVDVDSKLFIKGPESLAKSKTGHASNTSWLYANHFFEVSFIGILRTDKTSRRIKYAIKGEREMRVQVMKKKN